MRVRVRVRVRGEGTFFGVHDGNLDGMRGAQGVQTEGSALVANTKLVPQFPLGKQGISSKGLHPARKTLVQPQIVPPAHRDEVAEPLVR